MMRRVAHYWSINWDFWFLWFVVLLIALGIGGLLGAIGDTIGQIQSGY